MNLNNVKRFLTIASLLFGLSLSPLASAEGLVLASEVQCDFEITQSYFLLMYDSGRLEVVPTLTAPVRGRGDKSLVGGATWIVGGTLPTIGEEGPQTEKLSMVRAILRGPESLLKVVPVAVPNAEDLHPLDDATRDITALVQSRAQELERAEGKIVQAQAELERMRSGGDESTDDDKSAEFPATSLQQERVLAQAKRNLQSLEARYEKLKLQMQYPFDAIVQGGYELATERFRNEVLSMERRTRVKSDSSALSPEERQRLIELGRSFDPAVLKERLNLIRAKTRSFEDRLQNLGIDTELRSPDISPPPRQRDVESVILDEEEDDD